jgi:acyl-CoA thioesterase FadM
MNLWLRLIWMLLGTLWRQRAGVLDTTTMRLRVLPNDLDFNGHVNNGRYLTLADLGRLDFVVRTGLARVAFAQRAIPIVGDAVAKFRKDLKPFEAYELQTRVLGWDDKWTFMEHRFVRHGRVAGVVVMRGLFRGASGPISPAVFQAALGIAVASPPLPDWVLAWHRSCDGLAQVLRDEERALLPA